jgi:Tol biopolymer transport system component
MAFANFIFSSSYYIIALKEVSIRSRVPGSFPLSLNSIYYQRVRRLAMHVAHCAVFPIAAVLALGLGACMENKGTSDPVQREGAVVLETLKPEIAFPGRIVFQSDMEGSNEIYLMTSEKIVRLTHNTWSDEYPLFSPDGSKIAFSANPRGRYEIFIMNADGSGIHPLVETPEDQIEEAWLADGNGMAFTKKIRRRLGKFYSLWTYRFRSEKPEKLAPAFTGSAGLPAFSPSAPLVAFTGKRSIGWDVFVCDLKTGGVKPLTDKGKACRARFSPDGKRIVYVSHESDPKGDIWTMNADGGGQKRITVRDETSDYFPAWSPDGSRVVFCSNSSSMYADKGDWSIWIADPDTGECRLLFDSPGRDVFPDWRP